MFIFIDARSVSINRLKNEKNCINHVSGLIVFSACQPQNEIQSKVDNFIEVDLTADISHLSDKKTNASLLLKQPKLWMTFWQQAYGDKHALMESIKDEVY